MKNLSTRLSKVASYISKGSFVADVGSDHGALPIYLTNEGIVPFTQAIENKEGPFLRLSKAVEEEALYPERISLSLSSGLEALDPRVDTVVIAGMGGRLISSILEEHQEKLDKIETLILDAHSEWDVLLLTAAKLGYKVEEESFFYEDNIWYSVWKLTKTDEDIIYSQAELLFGPLECHRHNSDWQRFASEKKTQYERLLKNDIPEKRKAEIDKELKLLKEVMNED